jgi:outer membrane protein assembly factor BamD (BamD/ComL family)
MNHTLRPFLLGIALFLFGATNAEAFLGDLFKRGKEKRVLSAEQLSNQESSASSQLERAQRLQSEGKQKQARDAYESIVKSFPRTDSAAEAQFQYAKILQAEGDGRKAFEQFQELITLHRNSPNFSEAVERQFNIADELRNSERKGFLGLGAAIQPSKLIEMFEKIVETAPHLEFAPRSLLNIGYVHAKQGETPEALASFQKVVNAYQTTPYATEAQYEIFQLRGMKAERSNNPVEDRAQVEAGLDFVNQNPDDQRSGEIESNLQQIETREMEKKYNTGMFYEKSGKPDSARVYYRDVVKNPNTPWAAKAQERLNALDSAPPTVESRAGFFGPKPLRRDDAAMRTSEDEVVPLPAAPESE